MNILRSIYRLIQKARRPSLDDRLERVLAEPDDEERATQKSEDADVEAAMDRMLAPDDEAHVRHAWERLQLLALPRSACLSEVEVARAQEHSLLPESRQAHLDQCCLCQELVGGTQLSAEEIAKRAKVLASPQIAQEAASEEEEEEVATERATRKTPLLVGGLVLSTVVGAFVLFPGFFSDLKDRLGQDPSALTEQSRQRAKLQVEHEAITKQLDDLERERQALERERNAAARVIKETEPSVEFKGLITSNHYLATEDYGAGDGKPAIIVTEKDKKLVYFLDTAKAKKKWLVTEGVFEGSVSGRATLNKYGDVVIRVDDLHIDRKIPELKGGPLFK